MKSDTGPRKRLRNPFKAERLGGFLPFFWYGMRVRHWLRLLALGHYDITLNRLPNILGVTLMSPISSTMFRLSENIFRRRAEAVEILPPVFVVGHWRSGTTYLHNLLACDPATAFPTTFECTFAGGFLLTERGLGWALAPFLPAKRPMDDVPVGRDRPFEDEFALMKIGAMSPYLGQAFPRQGAARWLPWLDLEGLTGAERNEWEEKFMWLMRRFQYANPGRRLALKSPSHTARIRTLVKLFPGAKFVHIARNPFDIYPSTYRLWKVTDSRLGLHNPASDDAWLPDYILSTLPRMYAAYERDVALLPPGRLAEIRYEELAAKPVETVRKIYEKLDLGDFAPVETALTSYLEKLGGYEPNTHSVGDSDRRRIVDRWGFYFDRFGYDRVLPTKD